MGLRTVEEYLAGLKNDRTAYYRGARVADVTEHPELAIAVRHAATDFAIGHNPTHRELAVASEGGRVLRLLHASAKC